MNNNVDYDRTPHHDLVKEAYLDVTEFAIHKDGAEFETNRTMWLLQVQCPNNVVGNMYWFGQASTILIDCGQRKKRVDAFNATHGVNHCG